MLRLETIKLAVDLGWDIDSAIEEGSETVENCAMHFLQESGFYVDSIMSTSCIY